MAEKGIEVLVVCTPIDPGFLRHDVLRRPATPGIPA